MSERSESPVPEYCQAFDVVANDGSTKRYLFPKALDLNRPKRPRTTFSTDQLKILESEFQKNPYLVGSERCALARRLHLKEIQVKVWFQNRRTKTKKGSDGEKDTKSQKSSISPTANLNQCHPQDPAILGIHSMACELKQPLYLNIPTNIAQNPFVPPNFSQFYVDFLR
ncbi:unnamed protein product [Bursaphelenchus xylophilus]|uniref:(pine wood nematode) hypothetical protein n=1 Tax=Bursaphelenchus xylophilus TaxID=6326 RepID=A0A7I8WS91_BURXY|nr:unnamed protein product [Bursaphelenchus xylophilus]CAG9115182.1 unnamed protein product [Bursaphelenchus xylophilus]